MNKVTQIALNTSLLTLDVSYGIITEQYALATFAAAVAAFTIYAIWRNMERYVVEQWDVNACTWVLATFAGVTLKACKTKHDAEELAKDLSEYFDGAKYRVREVVSR